MLQTTAIKTNRHYFSRFFCHLCPLVCFEWHIGIYAFGFPNVAVSRVNGVATLTGCPLPVPDVQIVGKGSKNKATAGRENNTRNRVWKGFCVIRDSAEIERVIREYRKNPAVIREFYIGCDAGFSFSVVRDSRFPPT